MRPPGSAGPGPPRGSERPAGPERARWVGASPGNRDDPARCVVDAHAEHARFQRYTAAAASAERTGAITILVSHRFSTVRMADLIVLLAAGRAIEVGSHRALRSAGGRYAEPFELQAAGYR